MLIRAHPYACLGGKWEMGIKWFEMVDPKLGENGRTSAYCTKVTPIWRVEAGCVVHVARGDVSVVGTELRF